jgi:protein regulator of cytokinesis 1
MTRQTSNASSVETSTSAVSGSENWETYTDASDDDEPDVRMPYHGKVRTVKRDSPEDSAYEGAAKSFGQKVRAIGASDDGSEAAWSDVGETFWWLFFLLFFLRPLFFSKLAMSGSAW